MIRLALVRLTPRQFVRRRLAQRDVSGLPVRRNLTRIDLVPEIAVDDPFGPGSRANRGIFRIDSRNAGNDPVGVAQVEARIEPQRHHRCRRLGRADAGAETEHAVLVHAQVTPPLRELEDTVERLPLDPMLELTGLIARISTAFEHRDHDDLDLDGSQRGRERRAEQHNGRHEHRRRGQEWRHESTGEADQVKDGRSRDHEPQWYR